MSDIRSRCGYAGIKGSREGELSPPLVADGCNDTRPPPIARGRSSAPVLAQWEMAATFWVVHLSMVGGGDVEMRHVGKTKQHLVNVGNWEMIGRTKSRKSLRPAVDGFDYYSRERVRGISMVR